MIHIMLLWFENHDEFLLEVVRNNLINSNTVKNQVQTKNQRIEKISPPSGLLNITRTNLSIMLCYVMVYWRGLHSIFPKRCITKLRLSHMILACLADLYIIKIVLYHLNTFKETHLDGCIWGVFLDLDRFNIGCQMGYATLIQLLSLVRSFWCLRSLLTV